MNVQGLNYGMFASALLLAVAAESPRGAVEGAMILSPPNAMRIGAESSYH